MGACLLLYSDRPIFTEISKRVSSTKRRALHFHLHLSSRFERRKTMAVPNSSDAKLVSGAAGYVLEDVPHFSDYIENLPVCFFVALSFG